MPERILKMRIAVRNVFVSSKSLILRFLAGCNRNENVGL